MDYSPATGIKATSFISCSAGRIMTAGYVFCISFLRKTRSRSERFHHGNQRARVTNISSIVFPCQVTILTLYMSTNYPTIINLHLICSATRPRRNWKLKANKTPPTHNNRSCDDGEVWRRYHFFPDHGSSAGSYSGLGVIICASTSLRHW